MGAYHYRSCSSHLFFFFFLHAFGSQHTVAMQSRAPFFCKHQVGGFPTCVLMLLVLLSSTLDKSVASVPLG